jgi:ABC-type Fe3+/spermidine/putrescine transport system ATPase subunit
MKKVTKEMREKMGEALKKIKYRLFQAEIGYVSHDHERLANMAKRISVNARKITKELAEEKPKVKKRRKIKSSTRRYKTVRVK